MSGVNLDKDQIGRIVERVVARLNTGNEAPKQAEPTSTGSGMFATVDEAVNAATVAFQALASHSLKDRARMITSMRKFVVDSARALSELAVEETGMGRVEDKIIKNRLAATGTPGTEVLQATAFTGDNGITLMERAPYGVIGSITPCTNPTETVVCNAIGMIAGGNTVVFNAHPTAKSVTAYVIGALNEAIVRAGGPPNLLTAVASPTIQSAQDLMKHPGVRLLVVTGGPAVVNQAMLSGKKVIAAGPGNPPAIVDETANISEAAKHIVDGASFDNNIVCVVEKEIICVDEVADALKQEMKKNGAFELNPVQIRKMEKLIIDKAPAPGVHGMPNKAWVGKDAWKILRAIGLDAKENVRLVFCEVDRDHPFVALEQLMPVIPLVRVKNVDEAIELALKVEHGFRHTATMHSTNIDNLSKMARVCDTSIFVKNGPSFAGLGAGGEGHTSFTIASPTGEGLTTAKHFTRERRCVMKDRFRIV